MKTKSLQEVDFCYKCVPLTPAEKKKLGTITVHKGKCPKCKKEAYLVPWRDVNAVKIYGVAWDDMI